MSSVAPFRATSRSSTYTTPSWRFAKTQRQRDQLQKICGPAAFAKYILEQTRPHEPGDVILITGVGEVYPFLRAHDLLNNMLADFGDVPVVIAYPGSFNGQQFRLFNRLGADSYYRAFDIS